VVVDEENLAGRHLASGRTCASLRDSPRWQINLMTEESRPEQQEESGASRASSRKKLDVDEEVANILIEEGFST